MGVVEKTRPTAVYYSPPFSTAAGDFSGPKRPLRLEFPPTSSKKVQVDVMDLWVHRPVQGDTSADDVVEVSSESTPTTGRPPLAPKRRTEDVDAERPPPVPKRRTEDVDAERTPRNRTPESRDHTSRDRRKRKNDSIDELDDWHEFDDEDNDDDFSTDLDCKDGVKALKLHKLRRQRQLTKIAHTGDGTTCWLRPRDILDEERWLFPSEVKPAEYGLAIDQMYAQWREKLSEAGRTLCGELTEALKTWNKLWHRTRQDTGETCSLLAVGTALVGQVLFQLAIPGSSVPEMSAAIKKIKSLKVLDYEKATSLLTSKPTATAVATRQAQYSKRRRDESSSDEDSPPRQRRFNISRPRYSDRRQQHPPRDRDGSDRRRQSRGRDSFSRGGGRQNRRGRGR